MAFSTKKKIRLNSIRKGSAAVEAALILPVLVAVTLMAVDIAQYINVSQTISNASREGARLASKDLTKNAAEVESAITEYFGNVYPELTEQQMLQALEVEVFDQEGNLLSDLESAESGTLISVRVSFDFRTVRWLGGLQYWSGDSKQKTSFCRRE